MMHMVEIAIIIAHILVIISEWPKVLRGLNQSNSAATKATSRFLSFMQPYAIFLDMILIVLSCWALWLSGISYAAGEPWAVMTGIVFGILAIFVAFTMVPEDHETYINSP